MVLTGEFEANYPVVGSHEPTGTVVALGEDAEKEKLVEIGTRVAGLLQREPCGKRDRYLLKEMRRVDVQGNVKIARRRDLSIVPRRSIREFM